MMEPLYKNITKSLQPSNEITRRNSKRLEFEAAYLNEIYSINNSKKANKKSANSNAKKPLDTKNQMQQKEVLYDTSIYLYDTNSIKIKRQNKNIKYNSKSNSKVPNKNSLKKGLNTSRIYNKVNKNNGLEGLNKSINNDKKGALSKSFEQFPANKTQNANESVNRQKYNFKATTESEDENNNNNFTNKEKEENSNSNNLLNYNTNYSNNVSNLNANNITSDNIKINILRNFEDKSKLNYSASQTRNSLNANGRNYNNISNLLNVSTSSNKHLKNSINNFNKTNNLNITNYSRAKSIGAKDIKKFNAFVNIEDAFFKLKPEKSLERKNMKLNEKENETVFNTSMNISRFQKLVEDLKENTISDIFLVIEKTKQVKEELECSIDAKTVELNNLKNELNKTKKSNLTVAVDNQNMEMIQNETLRENNSMGKQMNNLMNEYNQQENPVLNGEVSNEKINVELLRNDVMALKHELKITNEDINHIRHLIVKQKKDNEALKKLIVKQETANQRYFQEVELLMGNTREFTNKFKSQLNLK